MALVQCCSGFVVFFDLINRSENPVNLHNTCAYQTQIAGRPSSSVQHIPTLLYDKAHRGIWRTRLQILSLGNSPALIAYLEHHHPSTDGSFAVCIAAGNGNFLGKELYNSIPEEHRPQMKAKDRKVTLLEGHPFSCPLSKYTEASVRADPLNQRQEWRTIPYRTPCIRLGVDVSGYVH